MSSKIIIDTNREVKGLEIRATKGLESIVTAYFKEENNNPIVLGLDWEGVFIGATQTIDITNYLVFNDSDKSLNIFFPSNIDFQETIYRFEIKTTSVSYLEKMSLQGTLKVKIKSKH